jgi:O-antigen/teichoic acid export membrane protein
MTKELRSTIVKNSAYLGFSGLASAFFMYLFVVLAARMLGVAHFGVFNFTLTLVITGRTLFDIGLGNYAQREIARDAGHVGSLVWNILGIKSSTCSVMMR